MLEEEKKGLENEEEDSKKKASLLSEKSEEMAKHFTQKIMLAIEDGKSKEELRKEIENSFSAYGVMFTMTLMMM